MLFALLGFDTDNDSVFMNETVLAYCQATGVEFTRCPYQKNDQAWVEQKDGAVVRHTVGGSSGDRRVDQPDGAELERFLSSLRTAWQDGEVRPTSRPKEKIKRGRRRPDPLVKGTVQMRGWFEAEPWRTSREFLERLQGEQPGTYLDGQIRTVQRRLKEWRRDMAHQLIFGASTATTIPSDAGP